MKSRKSQKLTDRARRRLLAFVVTFCIDAIN